jgi:hypothetical protein
LVYFWRKPSTCYDSSFVARKQMHWWWLTDIIFGETVLLQQLVCLDQIQLVQDA